MWDWILEPNNQQTLAFLGAALAAFSAAVWKVYTHFSKRKSSSGSPNVLASTAGIAVGGDFAPKAESGAAQTFNFGISIEQYEAGVKRHERELREEFAKLTAQESEKRSLLEKELAATEGKLTNLEAAYKETKINFAEVAKTLEDFKDEFAPEQVRQAQEALTKNETEAADALLEKAEQLGEKQAAEAAYRRGWLAEIDFAAARLHFSRAAKLQPDNPHYLNQAGLIASTLGEYREAEPLYQRSLAIWEKVAGA